MTQFRDGFMMKSPLPKHQQKFYDKARELSEKSGTPGDYNRDDPKVNEQLAKAEEAEKSHESDSAAKMSPFQGYVDGEERASHYQPTADLYQGLINTMTSNVDKIAESKAEKEKDTFKKVGKRAGKIASEGVDYKFGETLKNSIGQTIDLNDGVNSFGGKYAVKGNEAEKGNAFQKYLKS